MSVRAQLVGVADRLVRRARGVLLWLATLNVGARGTLADILGLLRYAAAVALQEMGDRAALIARLRAEGYEVLDGDGHGGQASTPLVYDPRRLRLIRPIYWLISPARKAGKGAGPDRMKAKWLIGGLFRDLQTGRRVVVVSVHYPASQQFSLRRTIALLMTARIVSFFERRFRRALVFVLGDDNAVPGATTLAGFIRNAWTNTHAEGGSQATHGRRAIDFIWWRISRLIRFLWHRAIATSSDHHALIAAFDIRPTRRIRRRLKKEQHR